MNSRNMIVLGSFLILVLSACGDTTGDIPANQERANELVQAISNYAQEYGRFPDRLDVLVPEFIAEIPYTVGGREFHYYRLYEPDEYLLYFEVTDKSSYGCGYSSRLEDWECSFGD